MSHLIHKMKTGARWCVFLLFGLFAPPTNAQNDSQQLLRMAATFEQAGQFSQAADFYMRAAENNPRNMASYLGAKRVLVQMAEWQRFRGFILRLQEKHREVQYVVDLGFISFKLGNVNEARKIWKQACAENPQDALAYSLVAQAWADVEEYDDAIETYLLGRAALKNSLIYAFELARIYQLLQKYESMLDEYLAFASANPGQISFIQTEIMRIIDLEGNAQAMIDVMERKQKRAASKEWLHALILGDLYSQNRQYEKALFQFQELELLLSAIVKNQRPDSYQEGQFLYEFGLTALQEKQPLIAQQAFQTLITQFPKGPFARKADWQMVDVLIAEEQYAQAVAVLQKFIEKNSRSAEAQRALIKIGQISLDHLFDIDQAEDAYSRVLTQNQDKRLKLNALYELALCAQIRGNLEQADDYLQKARAWSVDENLDAEDHALYELALLQLYRHRPSAAIEYLEQIDSNQQPEEMNILENDALELLLLLRENGRDSTGLAAYGDARLLLLQRQYSAARSLLEIIRSSSSTSLAEEMKLLLARVYRQSGEIDLANQVLIEIYGNLEAFSRDYALLCLGENYELQADGDKAKESFEKILVEFPASIYLERARKGIRRLQ